MDNISYKGEVTIQKYTSKGKYKGYQQIHNIGTKDLFLLLSRLLANDVESDIGLPYYFDILTNATSTETEVSFNNSNSILNNSILKKNAIVTPGTNNASVEIEFNYNYYNFNMDLKGKAEDEKKNLFAVLCDVPRLKEEVQQEPHILAIIFLGNVYEISQEEAHILKWKMIFENGENK